MHTPELPEWYLRQHTTVAQICGTASEATAVAVDAWLDGKKISLEGWHWFGDVFVETKKAEFTDAINVSDYLSIYNFLRAFRADLAEGRNLDAVALQTGLVRSASESDDYLRVRIYQALNVKPPMHTCDWRQKVVSFE